MEGSLQILHLEDDARDAELIEENLIAEGFNCDVARIQTRQEFLAAAEGGRFDLILADFSLPAFDGLSALTIAQEKCPAVPFIFVSGAIGEEMAIETLRQGATDYVLKDRLSRLGPAVRRALDEVDERNKRRQATEELRQSQSQLEAILQGITEGITAQKPDGTLLFANQAAATLIGYASPAELLATPLAQIMARFELLDEQGQPFPVSRLPGRRALQGEQPEEIVLRFRIGETGQERWSIVNASPVYDAEGQVQFAINIFRDITERMHMFEAERAARARAEAAQQRLKFLARASRILARSLDYQTTLRRLARLAVPWLADWCAVDLLQPDGSTVRVAAAHVDAAKVNLVFELERRFPRRPEASRGLPNVLRSGRPELYPTVSEQLLHETAPTPPHRELVQQLGFTSGMVVPLKVRDQVLGALTLIMAQSGRRFNESDLALAEELAQRAAIAVDNARLYREATLLNQELEQRVARRTEELQMTNARLEAEIRRHRQSQALYEAIAENLPGGAVLVVDKELRYLLARGPVLDQMGSSKAQLEGKFVGDSWPADLAGQRLARYRAALAGQATTDEISYGGRSYLMHTVPLTNVDGEIYAALALSLDITGRKEAEETTRALLRRQQELSRKVVSAQEEERQRLSRELHDSAGQILTAIHLNLSMLAHQVAGDSLLHEQIAEAADMTRAAQEEIRAASHALRPPALDTLGLNETLRSLCHDFARQANLQIAYVGVDVPFLSEQASISFYRFLQETLTNVAKHAQASVVKVSLNYDGDELRLSVEDNGVGMLSLNHHLFAAGRASGVGLLGLRERFELIGGIVAIESWPQKGTRVAAHYRIQPQPPG